MGQGSKTPIAALAVLLLALGMVACGGEGDSDTTTGEAAQEQAERGVTAGANGDKGSDQGEAQGSGRQGEHVPSEPAGEFKPKQHQDSGGGSRQFRVKGGDNSVQEFGEEASEAEFEAAARALHNFLDARADGHWAAACEYLASEITESLERLAEQGKQPEQAGCPALLGNLTNPAAKQELKKARKADVGSLRIEGQQSFVIYRGLEGTIMAMPMTEEDGKWKVASLAGTPLN